MCAHRCHGVGSQPRADIYNRTSAVFLGCRIMKPHFGGFTSVSPQEMTILWQKWKNAVFYSQKMII